MNEIEHKQQQKSTRTSHIKTTKKLQKLLQSEKQYSF